MSTDRPPATAAPLPVEELPFRRVLVTGGSGFIGSNLVRHLLGTYAGIEVVNLDALTYAGNPTSLADLEEDARYRFVHGRVEDSALCERLLREEHIEAVLHLAAETHVDRSIQGPQVFVTTNVLGTQVLLDAARAAGVKRLLYVGTDEVYGPTPEGASFDEDTPFRPSSPYAATKAAAEFLALAAGRTYGLDVVITRCTNNYGPYQFPEKLIPLAILNALEELPIPVYGDGLHVRDWIHVEDHCRAICAVLGRGRAQRAYNVASGQAWHNRDLVLCVLGHLGRDPSLIRHVTDRPGHDRRYAISAARLADEVGWRPRVALGDGLKQTIDWYLANRAWWDRVRDGSYRRFYDELYARRLEEARPRGKDEP